jgi:uncharacterized membrane protein YvlD (DUF360 family)
MVRLLVRTGILLVANAVGLIVASIVLSRFDISVTGFIVALLIFTACTALLTPFLQSQFQRRNSAALGGVALIATLLSLIVTDLVSDGLDISGVGTWLASAVIVWACALLAAFILPYLGLKKYLESRDDRR